MNLSIWSSYYMDLSPEDAILELEKNGIEYCELSDEHGYELLKRGNAAEVGKAFGEFALAHNIHITQGHLWLLCKICTSENAINTLKDWIDLFVAIGIKNAVLHCDAMQQRSDLSYKQKLQCNIEQLKIIDKYLENKDITICLENLRQTTTSIDDLLYIIDSIGSNHFAVCLDTGHLNISKNKNQREFILKAGNRLRALHIADNEGERDQHLMPFGIGSVDFKQVTATLKEINYSGLFNLEIPGERSCPLEIRGYKIQYIRKCYEYLMNITERIKK